MNVPIKTCPACGADLSIGTAALPGVCPACGRDLRLEEIVAKLRHSDHEPKRKGPPLAWGESAIIVFLLCLFLATFVMVENVSAAIAAFLWVTPNLFLGLFTAGFFARSVKTQLAWGALLGILFFGMSVIGLIYVGCRGL